MVRLKNIPEESRERLYLYLKTQSQQIALALNEAMSLQLDLNAERCGVANVEELGSIINSTAIVGKISLSGVEKANMYIVADLVATHVMNGIMILTPADIIKSSIEKAELSESDAETFEEVLKTIVEGINNTFENVLSSSISGESSGIAKANFKPGIKSLPSLPQSDYLVMSYNFLEEEYPKVHFHLLIPRSVGERVFDCSLEPVIDWSDRTIVVVFDTSDRDRTKIRTILEKENIGVADFDNHKDILRSLSKEDVDLIIMEITQNNWDSLMIGKHIRKTTRTMNIPIVFTMRHPTDKVLFLAYKQGIKNFLTKPIKKRDLLKIVNELIEQAA